MLQRVGTHLRYSTKRFPTCVPLPLARFGTTIEIPRCDLTGTVLTGLTQGADVRSPVRAPFSTTSSASATSFGETIRRAFYPESVDVRAGEFMHAASSDFTVTVKEADSVVEAARKMNAADAGASIVLSGNDVVGIFTERDYVRKVAYLDIDAHSTSVGELMTPNPRCLTVDSTLDKCVEFMLLNQARHVPIVDDVGEPSSNLRGIVSISDIIRKLHDLEQQSWAVLPARQNSVAEMLTTSKVRKTAGAATERVSPHTSVKNALKLMTDHNIGAVLVGDNGVRGIFTERDYMRKIVGGHSKPTDPMSEVMTRSPVVASPSHSVVQALAILAEGNFRHLPIVEREADGGSVCRGVLSVRDLLNAIYV